MATYTWRYSAARGSLITVDMINEVSTAARACSDRHCPSNYTSFNGDSGCSSYNGSNYASAYSPNTCCFRSSGGSR